MIRQGRPTRLVAALALALAVFTGDAAASGRRLLILSSHLPGHITESHQEKGVIQALEEAGWHPGRNIAIERHAMNTVPANASADRIARQVGQAAERVARFRPEIILAIGDNAFGNIALPLAKTPVDIVFCGLQGQPETYNRFIHFMESRRQPGFNVTGIYEKRHIRQALELFSKVTALGKVRFFQDRSTPGQVIAKQIDLELTPENAPPLPCATDRIMIPSWEAYCREISRINATPEIGAFYLGARLLRDGKGKIYTTAEIIRYAIENAKKPAIGIDYSATKMGLCGGASVDFFAMGYQAGEMIAAILHGARAGDLPIQNALLTAIVFNLTRAEALGLRIPSEILLAADEIFRQ